MAMKPTTAFKKITQKYEEIAALTKIIDEALEAKYGDVSVHHNWADGVVLLFDDDKNASITTAEIAALLDERVSIEEGMSYLREKTI